MKNKLTQKNIPEGWSETRLSAIGNFSKGAGISKEQLSPSGHNAIRYGELYTKHNFHIRKVYSFVSDEVAGQATKVKYGDIIFAGSGETIDEIGKSAAYLLKEDAYAGGDTIIFRPKSANSLFLSYFLNIGEARKKLRELGQGQSIVHIYKSDIENLKLHLPSLPEQNRIVAVLELWDEAIQKTSQKIENKKNIKKSLTQYLLTGHKRLDGFHDKWKFITLGESCKKIKTGKLDANAMVEGGKYRFYTCAKDFYYINEYAFDTEALLVSGNGANVGYIHYYKGKFNAYQRTYVLYDFTENILFIKYLLDVFLKTRIKEEVREGNTPYITMDTLTDMSLKVPSPQEQQVIVNILATADKEITELESKLALITDQKSYLLNKLITGTIRTPEKLSTHN